MVSCKKYDKLAQDWKDQIKVLIKKMIGKSHVADIIIEESDIKSYDFKVTICKYNSVKGWATIGYLRNDLFKGGIWRLTYKPRLQKGERNDAGKTDVIAAKDLRIGNLLEYDGKIITVDARFLLWLQDNNQPGFYKPIPLSPKLLKRCQFERYRDTSGNEFQPCYRNHKLGLEYRQKKYFTIMWYDADDDYGSPLLVRIDYLHQFQNLYYYLTGSELPVNLTEKA